MVENILKRKAYSYELLDQKYVFDLVQVLLHDIRSPLASIGQYFTMLESLTDQQKIDMLPKVKQYLQIPDIISREVSSFFFNGFISEPRRLWSVEQITDEVKAELKDILLLNDLKILLLGTAKKKFLHSRIKPLFRKALLHLISNSLSNPNSKNKVRIELETKEENGMYVIIFCEHRNDVYIPVAEKAIFTSDTSLDVNQANLEGSLYILKAVLEQNNGTVKIKKGRLGGFYCSINSGVSV